MSPTPVTADHLTAYTGLLHLAVRLLAREIDPPLYRQLTTANAPATDDQRPLIDARLTGRPQQKALEDLAVEYCRLFIGPQPECPPYASAHRGEVKLGGRSAHDIDDFMDRHRLRPVLNEHDAVLQHDHLAVELSLLAHLYDTAAKPADSHLTADTAWAAAHTLLHNHIWPWADDYLRRLQHTAELAPYTTIAHLTWQVLNEASTWPDTTDTDPTIDNAALTLYSAPWCAFCKRLKKHLDREKIPYTEINVEQDPTAAETVKKINNGNQIIPTVVFADGTTMTNPTITQVKHQLDPDT
ncbi:mycoredoxin [Actinomadura sp. 3N508]|uniref:mycoredoxin n=1 Tax=Actinomadura sp. 3N508 TaxID=3375153 RepID=UPI0037B39FB0